MSEELAFRELEYHYDIIRAFERSEIDNILTELIYTVKFPEMGDIYPLAWTNSTGTIFEYKRNYDYLIDSMWISANRSTKQRLWIDNEVALIYDRPVSTTSCTTRVDFGSPLLVPKGSYFTLSVISTNAGGFARMYCYGATIYGKKLVKHPLYCKKHDWEDILVEKIAGLQVRCPQAELVTYYIFQHDVILDQIIIVLLYKATKYPELGPHFVNAYCMDLYIDDVHMVRLNGYRSVKFNPGDLLIRKGDVLKIRTWHGITERYTPTNFVDIYGRELMESKKDTW